MKSSFVYILKCSDDSFYTGITSNLELRLIQHQKGLKGTSFTAKKLPVTLVYYQHFMIIEQAIAFEKQVKGWSRKKKSALINRHWDKLKEFSRCLNRTSHKNYRSFDSAQEDDN